MATNASDAATGMQLARQERFAEALPYLERAHRAAPTDGSVLQAVAVLMVLAGRGDEAEAAYRFAAAFRSKDLGLLCGWARIALMRGVFDQALDLCEQALAVDSRFADAGGLMAKMLQEATDPEIACDLLETLVGRHPLHAGMLGILAMSLLRQERLHDAQVALECFHALRPHEAWARIELGGLALGRGDREVAREHFRAVLQAEPTNGIALWALAETRSWRLDAAQLAAVKRAIAANPEIRQLTRLHETLSRHHDRASEFPAAWRHAARTNALAIEASPPERRYDAAVHETHVDQLIGHYTAPLLERLRGSGCRDHRPVFVIGLPRSGTTLLERMLAAHPDIVGVGEQQFAEAGWKRALKASGPTPDAHTSQAISEAARWHLRQLEQRVRNLGLHAHAQRIVDKMPNNYLMAGWLRLAFPNVAIIHVQRDPRDVAISCWFAQFDHVQWINELRHIAHRIEQHRRLMRHWHASFHDRLIEVRYEKLVADPESELRRVLAALGMGWHPDVVAFAGHEGYVTTASRQQVREPLHARSVSRWRNYAVALKPILGRLDAIAFDDAHDMMTLPRVEDDAVVEGMDC